MSETDWEYALLSAGDYPEDSGYEKLYLCSNRSKHGDLHKTASLDEMNVHIKGCLGMDPHVVKECKIGTPDFYVSVVVIDESEEAESTKKGTEHDKGDDTESQGKETDTNPDTAPNSDDTLTGETAKHDISYNSDEDDETVVMEDGAVDRNKEGLVSADRIVEGIDSVEGNDILLEEGDSAGGAGSKVSDADMADVSQLLDTNEDDKME